ncbi:hypothetical protein E2C01_006667 [Portunus trituberculatus]|uniref:Uncharacterized protein n=1 Tax=Portunus trituberculatus TaxID=210409 RepID=A0A5B7CXF3_PORTR|nr:hypothetical protein [Portunus trituberculatus]
MPLCVEVVVGGCAVSGVLRAPGTPPTPMKVPARKRLCCRPAPYTLSLDLWRRRGCLVKQVAGRRRRQQAHIPLRQFEFLYGLSVCACLVPTTSA